MVTLKRLICGLLVLIMSVGLTACSNSRDAYIYFEMTNKPVTLDPQTAERDEELLIIKNIFEGLMRKDSDGNIVRGVAENYEKNGLTYKFTIRKNAKWNSGEDITAKDFVFALRRALEPKTKSPFASRLFCIKNAKSINNGSMNSKNLGVKANDKKTLTITLEYDEPLFLEYLSTSAALPCNEKFFNECAGKYGLSKEFILGNGSYRLGKWNKETFGIRLYRNENYKGSFKTQNAAVFLTCVEDETPVERLQKNSVDIAFIDSSFAEEMKNSGFTTYDYQNICWIMTISKDYPAKVRKSLIKLIGNEVYGEDLKSGYASANSIFPAAYLTNDEELSPILNYDPDGGKKLFVEDIKTVKENKLFANTVLYYYDNGAIKPVITDIVGHWQNNLSAFVNIESVSSPEYLISELKEQTVPMAIFPVKCSSQYVGEYLKNFGLNYKNENLDTIQTKLLSSNNIFPILFQNTVICCSPAIGELHPLKGDGYIDFSWIAKN